MLDPDLGGIKNHTSGRENMAQAAHKETGSDANPLLFLLGSFILSLIKGIDPHHCGVVFIVDLDQPVLKAHEFALSRQPARAHRQQSKTKAKPSQTKFEQTDSHRSILVREGSHQ